MPDKDNHDHRTHCVPADCARSIAEGSLPVGWCPGCNDTLCVNYAQFAGLDPSRNYNVALDQTVLGKEFLPTAQ